PSPEIGRRGEAPHARCEERGHSAYRQARARMAGCPAAAGSSRRNEETLKSRVGVFGGTFDPVHVGHLAIAVAALESVPLDRVLFVPARRSPLKDRDPLASVADRVAMIEAAI